MTKRLLAVLGTILLTLALAGVASAFVGQTDESTETASESVPTLDDGAANKVDDSIGSDADAGSVQGSDPDHHGTGTDSNRNPDHNSDHHADSSDDSGRVPNQDPDHNSDHHETGTDSNHHADHDGDCDGDSTHHTDSDHKSADGPGHSSGHSSGRGSGHHGSDGG